MKKKGGILLLLSQLIISTVLLPFFASPVHADTISGQDTVGTDVSYTAVDSIQYQGTSSGLLVYWNTGTVHIQWKLKKAVIGVVRLQFDIEYFTRENNQWATSTVTEIVNAKLNGDTFVYEFNLNSFGPLMYTWMDTDNNNVHTDNPLRGWSTTILSSNVTFYDDLTDLQGILDILQDIYSDTTDIVGLSTNQLSELQAILLQCQALGITLTDVDNQLIDVNSELDIISSIRQFNIPFESFSFVHSLLYLGIPLFSYLNNYSYIGSYPVFSVPANSLFYRGYVGSPNALRNRLTFSLATNKNINNVNLLTSVFNIDTSIVKVENFVYRDYVSTSNVVVYVTFDIVSADNSGHYFDFTNGNGVLYLAPFYSGYSSNGVYNVSTDFALQFGLSNQLLDDLHLIAQGTQQSNSSADNLEDNNDQMASDMDSLATIENGYNQDFNNQLQNIDFSNPIQQNSGLLSAANFVISVFNGLISNNPFSTLIIIVCILLIGKKVIGK